MARKKNKVQYKTFNEVGDRTTEILFEGRDQASKDTLLVLITHSFQSSIPYITACERVVGKDNIHIVLKSSSDNSDFRELLEVSGYSVSEQKKKDYKQRPDKVISEIKELLREKNLGKVLVMDHGGYASYHLQELTAELPISGIVEYTINGENKFNELFRFNAELRDKIKYFSIGKTPLKIFPDRSCGRLIGQMTGQIVQEFSGFSPHLRDFTQVGVVGFGTLGREAVQQLRLYGAHNVIVHDIDELKRTEAALDGFTVVENSMAGLGELAARCNVIIAGTDGNGKPDGSPIPREIFRKMRPETVITGVTSADDTWALDQRIRDGDVEPSRKKMLKGKITPMKMEDGRYIYAIYDGEAPNLAGSEIGVNDPSINLPTSMHVIVAYHIASTGKVPTEEEVKSYTQIVAKSYNQAFFEIQEKARSGNGKGRLHV